MALLDVIEVACNGLERRIELHHGDLTDLSPEHSVDVLILSAFPGDYLPTPSSLIGALSAKGVSVSDLAHNMAVDLRQSFSCWMSQRLQVTAPGLRFNQILCFEPLVRGSPPDVVGDIFRALSPFLAGDPPIRTAAMPIVAAGDQGYSVAAMLPPLVDAAIHWMRIGMPLDTLKIFAYSEPTAKQAAQLFAALKEKNKPTPARTPHYEYDVFISYCRANEDAAQQIKNHLSKHKLRLFVDTQELERGAAWQPHIFRALDSCRRMVAVYSPSYINSKVCQEEFNIAWARGRKHDLNVIYPIYWQSAELPTYMDMLVYSDCRELHRDRLVDACATLVRQIQV